MTVRIYPEGLPADLEGDTWGPCINIQGSGLDPVMPALLLSAADAVGVAMVSNIRLSSAYLSPLISSSVLGEGWASLEHVPGRQCQVMVPQAQWSLMLVNVLFEG